VASAGGLRDIIASLERRKSAIDSALSALRAVGGTAGTMAPVGKKRGRPRKIG
jgi:hypothetical protein